MLHATKKILGLLVLTVMQSGCGGDSSSGSGTPPPVVNASPGGIWQGTDSVSGLAVVGIVTEMGKFDFIRADSTQYVGTVITTGNSISGNVDGYTAFGTSFPDGSIHGAGTFTGTVSERKTLDVTINFKTDSGTSTTNVIPMTFNAVYDQGSALSTVAGNYTDAATGTVISVSASGAVFAQNATTGCVTNGTIAPINTAYNAYTVTNTYASCTGDYAVLNGTTFSGMGAIDNSAPPVELLIGTSGAIASGGTGAFVETWDAT